jgi:hypothetical protein
LTDPILLERSQFIISNILCNTYVLYWLSQGRQSHDFRRPPQVLSGSGRLAGLGDVGNGGTGAAGVGEHRCHDAIVVDRLSKHLDEPGQHLVLQGIDRRGCLTMTPPRTVGAAINPMLRRISEIEAMLCRATECGRRFLGDEDVVLQQGAGVDLANSIAPLRREGLLNQRSP